MAPPPPSSQHNQQQQGFAMPVTRRHSTSFLTGYEALGKCNLAIDHTTIPEDALVRDEVRALALRDLDEGDPEVAAMCRREVSRLDDLRRLEAEARAERAVALREAAARREKFEAERKARADRAAAEAERRRQAEAAEDARRRQQAAIEDMARQRAARDAAVLRDESFAKRLASEQAAYSDAALAQRLAVEERTSDQNITQLKALIGADDQTCKFYLESAGGDVQQAYQIWQTTSS
mmetsp:Transcript_36455/g.116852  ORF Transcript_36455/g.116852 Transcript_36455/m.116852 type:complete len:236 (-) Transcript_36455:248-955(-)